MSEPALEPGIACAQELDRADELAHFRDAFVSADPELIYLDGNSLGRLPRATIDRLRHAVEQEWGQDLIRGWNLGWFEAPARIGDKVGQLVGAGPGQVLVADSTSINLFKLTMAALAMRPDRSRIVSDELNFPSDLYILQSCAALLGGQHEIRLIPSGDGIVTRQADSSIAIDEQTALVTLSHVAFRSGFLYDAAAVTKRAHAAGALVLWDLSHSAGVVPIQLDRWGVDLAVGCTYKYLNGGPGAPAFLYVRRDLQDTCASPIWGWFGQRAPFDFDLQYRPAQGIARFQVGTPPVLSLLGLEPAVELLLQAGIDQIRRKSRLLTSYAVYLVDLLLVPLGFSVGSPREPHRRGSHISIRHPDAYRVSRALIEELKVIVDFRDPDSIRLGLSPLTTTFSDVWNAVDRIRRVMTEQRHLRYSPRRLAVT